MRLLKWGLWGLIALAIRFYFIADSSIKSTIGVCVGGTVLGTIILAWFTDVREQLRVIAGYLQSIDRTLSELNRDIGRS